MKNITIILTGILLATLVLTGCGKNGSGRPGAAGAANTGMEKAEKPVAVMVDELKSADLKEYISFTAKLEGITDIYLQSESSGKVMEINKKLGDWVNKGEAIGKIENDSYLNQLSMAQANLLAAEASLELAQMQYDTSKKLFENKNISESEYITAQSGLKSAQSGYESAQSALKQADLTVKNALFTAPVSGYISDLTLEVGSYISMGQQVCRIVDNSRLMIKTGLGEDDITKIKKGQEVFVTYNGTGQKITGVISGMGIAPSSGSVNYPVEIELDNPDNTLLPGMVVSGRILATTYKQVIYTSINNINKVYDDYVVYTVNSDNRADMRKIQLGAQIERDVIIQSGVEVGDLLVIEGANSLSDQTLVEIKN